MLDWLEQLTDEKYLGSFAVLWIWIVVTLQALLLFGIGYSYANGVSESLFFDRSALGQPFFVQDF